MRVAILVCLVALSAGAQEDEDRAEGERQLESGGRLLEQGQPDKAHVRYEMAQRLLVDDPRPLLGLALADAQRHHCAEALTEIDTYLRKEKQPDPKALTVLSQCPRNPPPSQPPPSQPPRSQPPPAQTQPPPPPPEATTALPRKKRARLFTLGIEAGLNVPVTSETLHVDFLGTIQFGVAVAPRIGLSIVLLFESLVSRAAVTAGSSKLSTVFTENFIVGLEERYVVWRRLLVFGTLGTGIAVDSFHGFVNAGVLHVDLGVGWEIGPGEIRLRPLDFSFLVTGDDFGASWRASAGYAFRF